VAEANNHSSSSSVTLIKLFPPYGDAFNYPQQPSLAHTRNSLGEEIVLKMKIEAQNFIALDRKKEIGQGRFINCLNGKLKQKSAIKNVSKIISFFAMLMNAAAIFYFSHFLTNQRD
jgi:hypothetical protein